MRTWRLDSRTQYLPLVTSDGFGRFSRNSCPCAQRSCNDLESSATLNLLNLDHPSLGLGHLHVRIDVLGGIPKLLHHFLKLHLLGFVRVSADGIDKKDVPANQVSGSASRAHRAL